MDITKILNIQQEEKENLTEEELQGLYMYLSMNYEGMSNEEKKYWYQLMNELDPEYNNIEEDD